MKYITPNRPIRFVASVLVAAAAITACGQDIQNDAADDFIEVIKPSVESAGIAWSDDLESCLRGVVTGLSDEELKAVSDQAATAASLDPEVMERVTKGTQDCILPYMPTPAP